VSVKVFIIVIIDVKRYPRTYSLMQGRCFMYGNTKKQKNTSTLESAQPLETYTTPQ